MGNQWSNCTPAKPFPPSHQTEAIMNIDRRFVANFFFKPNHKFGCSTWTIAVPCLVLPCFPKRIVTGRRVPCDGIPTWPAARRIQPTRWLGCVECTPDFFLSRVMQGFLCRLVWLQSSNLTLTSGLLSQGVMSRALGANIWPGSTSPLEEARRSGQELKGRTRCAAHRGEWTAVAKLTCPDPVYPSPFRGWVSTDEQHKHH